MADKTKTKKLHDGLSFWEKRYDDMIARKTEWAAWLDAEVSYISGVIHRATRKKPTNESKILSVGAGPLGVIDFWPAKEKHAIDPLANEYKEKFHDFQDKSVNFVAGYAEDLPYENNYFDVVIIRNTLDHVENPEKALSEVFRVLKPGAVVYIWIHLYSWRRSFSRRTATALAKIFIKEPWAFTLGRIKRLLSKVGFDVVTISLEKRFETKDEKRERLFSQVSLKKRLVRIVWGDVLGFAPSYGFACAAIPNK